MIPYHYYDTRMVKNTDNPYWNYTSSDERVEDDTFYRLVPGQRFSAWASALRSLSDVWSALITGEDARYRHKFYVYSHNIFDTELEKVIATAIVIRGNSPEPQLALLVDKEAPKTLLKKMPTHLSFVFTDDIDKLLFYYQKPFPDFNTIDEHKSYIAGIIAYSYQDLIMLGTIPELER